jgi:hypothetical protein
MTAISEQQGIFYNVNVRVLQFYPNLNFVIKDDVRHDTILLSA